MAGKPAAKQGDKVVGTDTHIEIVMDAGVPVPTPLTNPFNGTIAQGCVATVLIEGKPAAVAGSIATNTPAHVPVKGTFQVPPTNMGTILPGAAKVLVGGKPLAVHGDKVMTCNDPAPLPMGSIVAVGKVFAG